MCFRNVKIVVFSPAQRQSILFTELVREGLKFLAENGKHMGFKYTFVENNKEIIEITNHRGDTNKLYALPSKEETTRGKSLRAVRDCLMHDAFEDT